jgi:hypothetical protein
MEEACDNAASLEAVPALVSVLTRHADDVDACSSACAALRNLVGGRTPLALAVAEAGGVPPLLAALSAHGGSEALARAAVGAVQNVAFYKELGPLLKSNGAVPRLLAAAAAHAGARALAAEALKRLGRDEAGALLDASAPARPPLTSVGAAPVRCFQGPAVGAPDAPLASLWASAGAKPTVLVFLRRLGCTLCRVYAQDVEALRVELGESARVVCLSFECFGEGSDAPGSGGGSFEEKGFFKGEMWQVLAKEPVYGALFGRGQMMTALGDVLSDKSGKIALANKRGVSGNMQGDGRACSGVFRAKPPPPHTHTLTLHAKP